MADGNSDSVPVYPIPRAYPEYESPQHKTTASRAFSLYAAIDALFIAASLALTFWFSALLFREGFSENLWRLLYLVPFFLVMAYLALPRMHQIFTFLYVPDYFISRTRTSDGLLGDPINLAINGSAADIHAAMQRAGWVRAEELSLRSSWGIIFSAITRRSYPEAPVSSLFLFGNRQEFAYQQEVDGSASQRHHVRFWQTPAGWLLPGGRRVQWLAAGTYDRSVGFSLFTGQITHKIDADIDLERDYIIDSVRYTDPECDVDVIQDFSTAYHSRNGGGDEVRTDGNLPVLEMTGAYERAATPVELPPATDTLRGVDRQLPPLHLIGAAVIGAVMVLLVILLGSLVAVLPKDTLTSPDEISFLRSTPIYTTVAVVLGVCLVLMFRHKRWARLLLMITATVMSFTELLSATQTGEYGFAEIVAMSISLYLVLALSSDSARKWVSGDKQDATVRLDRKGLHLERGKH